MRPIDPEILANRAQLENDLEMAREARRVSAGRWIVRGLLATLLLVMVCNLFVR